MAGDGGGLQGLFTRIGTTKRRDNTIKKDVSRGWLSKSGDDTSEANMIVNHINHCHVDHHHIVHHQGILSNTLNLVNFSTRRNCDNSSIDIMILIMIMQMRRCSMKDEGGSLILTPIWEVYFRAQIEETNFLILFVLLMEILIFESALHGSIKLMSCLTWSIFS